MISGENSKMSVALCIDRESNPDRPRGRSQFRSLRLFSFYSAILFIPIAVLTSVLVVSIFHSSSAIVSC